MAKRKPKTDEVLLKSLDLFKDYIFNINTKKDYPFAREDIDADELEKGYITFVGNRSMSSSLDSLFYANEINSRPHCPARLAYDYLFYALKKNKRFHEWLKKEQQEKIQVIMAYFKYNFTKAMEVAPLLSEDLINTLSESMSHGGTSTEK